MNIVKTGQKLLSKQYQVIFFWTEELPKLVWMWLEKFPKAVKHLLHVYHMIAGTVALHHCQWEKWMNEKVRLRSVGKRVDM